MANCVGFETLQDFSFSRNQKHFCICVYLRVAVVAYSSRTLFRSRRMFAKLFLPVLLLRGSLRKLGTPHNEKNLNWLKNHLPSTCCQKECTWVHYVGIEKTHENKNDCFSKSIYIYIPPVGGFLSLFYTWLNFAQHFRTQYIFLKTKQRHFF